MTLIQKIALGLSLVAATNLMAAKKATEKVGKVAYNKAYIDCDADGKKGYISDYLDIDEQGFDFTRFIPMLNQKDRVHCMIRGYIELPSEYTKNTIDLKVNGWWKSIAPTLEGNDKYKYFSIYEINGARHDNILMGLQVKARGSIKYLEYSVYSMQKSPYKYMIWNNLEIEHYGIPGGHIVDFFKYNEKLNGLSEVKFAKKRGEQDEFIPLDMTKLFVFEE